MPRRTSGKATTDPRSHARFPPRDKPTERENPACNSVPEAEEQKIPLNEDQKRNDHEMPQSDADIILEHSLCFHRRIEKALSSSLFITVLVVMPHRMLQMTHSAAEIQKNTFVVYLSFKAKAPVTGLCKKKL
jgi:hypothetical protein